MNRFRERAEQIITNLQLAEILVFDVTHFNERPTNIIVSERKKPIYITNFAYLKYSSFFLMFLRRKF